MKLTRFDFIDGEAYGEMRESEAGEYVRYTDVLAYLQEARCKALEELRRPTPAMIVAAANIEPPMTAGDVIDRWQAMVGVALIDSKPEEMKWHITIT